MHSSRKHFTAKRKGERNTRSGQEPYAAADVDYWIRKRNPPVLKGGGQKLENTLNIYSFFSDAESSRITHFSNKNICYT